MLFLGAAVRTNIGFQQAGTVVVLQLEFPRSLSVSVWVAVQPCSSSPLSLLSLFPLLTRSVNMST